MMGELARARFAERLAVLKEKQTSRRHKGRHKKSKKACSRKAASRASKPKRR
ncbi:MAG: hypothetical protein JKY65_05145 [Planctomycetes bacterium]|nr:hypothetical protein [Planctomycetota bacterium]